ncbi:hypothetical protein SESBI_34983 [Sesbania bispinosa]|nr:hypothetical protein SESBI_34983 [Sesbania bispinosa]
MVATRSIVNAAGSGHGRATSAIATTALPQNTQTKIFISAATVEYQLLEDELLQYHHVLKINLPPAALPGHRSFSSRLGRLHPLSDSMLNDYALRI